MAVVIGAGGAARANHLRSSDLARLSGRCGRQPNPRPAPKRWSRAFRRFDNSRALGGSRRPNCGRADLLVNASTLGMIGQQPLPIELSALPEHAVVTDAVYVPLRTPLIEAASARGFARRGGAGDAASSGRARLRALVRQAPRRDASDCALGSKPKSSRPTSRRIDHRRTDGLDRDGEVDRRRHVCRAWRPDI